MSQDSALQQAVTDELKWEPSVASNDIGVTAKAGVVVLTGHVENYAAKHAAEIAASRVKGVKAVADELEVRLPVETKRTDERIAAAAVDRLSWDVSIPRDAVQVRIEHGWVTLTGEVDYHYQKDLAQQELRRLVGVVGITNQVTIRPRVDAPNLRDDITLALHRSWFLDPQTVHVGVDGGQVHLTGTVHSLRDRQIAASAAWSTHGVTGVANDLMIN